MSIKVTCPKCKDDQVITKYKYDQGAQHYVIKKTQQLTPGSNSDSEEYISKNTLVYKNKNKEYQSVYQRHYEYNGGSTYLGTYKYNKDGYLTSIAGKYKDGSAFTYKYNYDNHGTSKSEGYKDHKTYAQYENTYDSEGRLTKSTITNTSDDLTLSIYLN